MTRDDSKVDGARLVCSTLDQCAQNGWDVNAAHGALTSATEAALDAQRMQEAQPALLHAVVQWTKAHIDSVDALDHALCVLRCILSRRGDALAASAVPPAMALLDKRLAHGGSVLEALEILIQLAQRNSKDLVAFWPQLLAPETPRLTVLLEHKEARMHAARAMSALFEYGQGFWGMARDSTYLSHSERLASMLTHVRARLATLLLDQRMDPVPLLELVHTLVVSTDQVPLHTTHAEVLWEPVLQWTHATVWEQVLAAYHAAAVMHPGPDAYSQMGSNALTWLLAQLGHADWHDALHACAWRLAATFLVRTELPVPDDLAPMLSRDVSSGSDETRCGAMNMLAALARLGHRTTHVPALRTMLPTLVANGARDRSLEVRMAVCRLWADFDLCLGPSKPLHLAHLHVLTRDTVAEVRAAAVRAVGTRIEQVVVHGDEDAVESLLQCFTYEVMTRLLHARKPHGALQDHDVHVRVCAAWTLANYAALLARAPPRTSQGRLLLTAAIQLPRDEREAVHSVRALGTLLAVGARNAWFEHEHGARRGTASPLSSSPSPQSTLAPATPVSPPLSPQPITPTLLVPNEVPLETLYTRGIEAVRHALVSGRSPKLRWNAATSLFKALDAACAASLEDIDTPVEAGVHALGMALNDRTFKVQRIAAQGLVDLLEAPHAPILPPQQLKTLLGYASYARAALDDRIRKASFGEAQMHAQVCRQALERLETLLQSKPDRDVPDLVFNLTLD